MEDKSIQTDQASEELTLLDQILSDLLFHLHPEYLLDKNKLKIELSSEYQKKLRKRYYEILTAVRQAYVKVLKYPLFFEEFYPQTDKIRNSEALEHHIHSYLEDMTILKNKVVVLLCMLKNDLSKVLTNKDEVTHALKWQIGQVEKVFLDVSKHRNPHHHSGMKFSDSNLVDVEMAYLMTSSSNPLRSTIKPEVLSKLETNKTSSFEKAKKTWVRRAEINTEQIKGFLNEILYKNQSILYQFLELEPLNNTTTK